MVHLLSSGFHGENPGHQRREGASGRVGNARAVSVYEAHGYRRVGLRKGYYPAGLGQREDAIVMSLRL